MSDSGSVDSGVGEGMGPDTPLDFSTKSAMKKLSIVTKGDGTKNGLIVRGSDDDTNDDPINNNNNPSTGSSAQVEGPIDFSVSSVVKAPTSSAPLTTNNILSAVDHHRHLFNAINAMNAASNNNIPTGSGVSSVLPGGLNGSPHPSLQAMMQSGVLPGALSVLSGRRGRNGQLNHPSLPYLLTPATNGSTSPNGPTTPNRSTPNLQLTPPTPPSRSGQSRKRGTPIPNDVKDDAYWERRRKNNEAAKRSRDARRAKEYEIAIRAAFLENENLSLRMEVAALKADLAKLVSQLQ